MIESVLKEVRKAESDAEDIQKEAFRRGKQILLDAEAKAYSQKKAAVQECKEERARALQSARRVANDRTQIILKKGAEVADDLKEEKNSAVEDCADKIVAMLFEKYAK